MWKLEYSNEAKFYFLDSGDLVFGLLVEITKLSRVPAGIPPDGCTNIGDGLIWWEVLDHIVIYERIEAENRLFVVIVKLM